MTEKTVAITYNQDLDRYELNLDKDLVVTVNGDMYTFASNIYQQAQGTLHLNPIKNYQYTGEDLQKYLESVNMSMYQQQLDYMQTVYEIAHTECSDCGIDK